MPSRHGAFGIRQDFTPELFVRYRDAHLRLGANE